LEWNPETPSVFLQRTGLAVSMLHVAFQQCGLCWTHWSNAFVVCGLSLNGQSNFRTIWARVSYIEWFPDFSRLTSKLFNWEVVTSCNSTSVENRGHDPCAELSRCEAAMMFFSLVNERFLTRVSLELICSGSEEPFLYVALERIQ